MSKKDSKKKKKQQEEKAAAKKKKKSEATVTEESVEENDVSASAPETADDVVAAAVEDEVSDADSESGGSLELSAQEETISAGAESADGPTKVDGAITDLSEVEAAVLAIIFASPVALSTKKIKNLLTHGGYDASQLELVLESLTQSFQDRGIQLVKVSGGYQLRSHPKFGEIVQKLVEEKPQRLGKSALEVLSIIAYKQPITRADIDHVRGTDSGHLLKSLLEKNLVRTEGHKETAGRPLLYGTTPYFLEVFTLSSLDDLPAIEDFDRELKDAETESDPDALVLDADPSFFDKPSALDASADRGDYDNRAEESVEAPDFGEAERAQEEVAQSLEQNTEEAPH